MLPASAILENSGHCVCSDMKLINHLRLLHLSNEKSLKIVVSGTKPSTASKKKKKKKKTVRKTHRSAKKAMNISKYPQNIRIFVKSQTRCNAQIVLL